VLYAVSTWLYVYCFAFQREGKLPLAGLVAAIGLLPQSTALIIRWIVQGHGPYMTIFEGVNSTVWVGMVVFLVLQWRRPVYRFLGIAIMPISFLLIGAAILQNSSLEPVPATFNTFWLLVHVSFAKLSYGACLIATGFGIAYLIKQKQQDQDKLTPFYQRIPTLEVLDELSYRFTAFGFIMIIIMIISGAIWANKAWGRYWGWDPVETWSLISWLLYGLYLHLRFTFGWRGSKAAWYSVVALAVLLFAIFGVALFYVGAHSAYFK
jgi:cytochrome c-type biogenesis protein CcsB